MADHPLLRLETILLVAIGGFAGANLRFFVGTVLPGIPGTFVVNVVGSALLGFILYEAIHLGLLGEQSRIVFATGFLSSFTTYSTFALETVQATPTMAVVNVVASYVFGFGGVLAGRWLAMTMEGG